MHFRTGAALALCLGLVSGCVTPNELAMKVGDVPKIEGEDKSALSLRTLQIRRLDSLDEKRIMLAATQTLQDLGFTLTESDAEVGVLVASKRRDAEESGQIVGQVVVTILLAALGSAHNPVWDKEQTIYVTLVTTPIENSSQTEVRASFERRLVNNHGHLWRTELILDAAIYQEFFDKLSKATFLEAHKV